MIGIKYFKKEAESELGVGVGYIELSDGIPTRQVEIYGATHWWGDAAHPEHLADQELDEEDMEGGEEISSDEFERVWREAQAHAY